MEQVWKWGLLAQLKQCFILMSTGLQEPGILTLLGYHSPPPANFMFNQFQDPFNTSMDKLAPMHSLQHSGSKPLFTNQVKDASQTTPNELTLSSGQSVVHSVPFSTHSIPMVILIQGPLKPVEGQPASGVSFDHRKERLWKSGTLLNSLGSQRQKIFSAEPATL